MYVVAASGDQVVYDKTFQEALNRLTGLRPSIIQPPGAPPERAAPVVMIQEILLRLENYFGLVDHGKYRNAGGELQTIREKLSPARNLGNARP